MRTRLSIIVPVYNVAQYLRHCLQSILDQQLDSYEVILVNDASYDNSRGICAEWCEEHPTFHLINHDRNMGLSEARNTGLAHAQGQYITFVDSDDFLAPDTLNSCLEMASEGTVVEYPIRMEHLSDHAYCWSPMIGSFDFGTWMKNDGHTHCFACNKVYDINLWQGMSFPSGRYFEDILTIPYVLKKAQRIVGIDKGLYYYCSRKESISKSLDCKVLYDFLYALVSLKTLPENASNTRLYLRCLNAQRSYLKYGGTQQIVPKEPIPWSFLTYSQIPLRERVKALWFKMTYHGK